MPRGFTRPRRKLGMNCTGESWPYRRKISQSKNLRGRYHQWRHSFLLDKDVWTDYWTGSTKRLVRSAISPKAMRQWSLDNCEKNGMRTTTWWVVDMSYMTVLLIGWVARKEKLMKLCKNCRTWKKKKRQGKSGSRNLQNRYTNLNRGSLTLLK